MSPQEVLIKTLLQVLLTYYILVPSSVVKGSALGGTFESAVGNVILVQSGGWQTKGSPGWEHTLTWLELCTPYQSQIRIKVLVFTLKKTLL